MDVSSCAIWFVGRKVHTPHLPLLLEVGVYHAEGGFSRGLVVVDLDEVVDVEVEFAYFHEISTTPVGYTAPSTAHEPNGPEIDTVLLGILRYVVMSFLTHGSLITTSTLGGIEMGVLPSFEGRVAVAEKGRAVVWNAGTRKLGNVTTEEEVEDAANAAFPRTLPPLLGASIVVVGVWIGDLGVDNRAGFVLPFSLARLLQLTRSSKNLDGFGKASDEQGLIWWYTCNPNPYFRNRDRGRNLNPAPVPARCHW